MTSVTPAKSVGRGPLSGARGAAGADFYFSRPVEGYADTKDRVGSQNAEFKAWVEGLNGFLKAGSDGVLLVTYGGAYITDYQAKVFLGSPLLTP